MSLRESKSLRSPYTVSTAINTKVVIGWFKLQFECDWLIELSDNNLASELVENGSFLNQSQSRKL